MSNLSEHMKEIPWTRLPKTFQEAIIVVREIGIRFLWIDSLCIVQDDVREWEAECQRMGFVYENATLTLAASHSPDSHTGLFLGRLPAPTAVQLPLFLVDNDNNNNDNKARVFATTRAETADDTFPERGALNKRAWATQEWLLARRIVFYTKGQLVWSCKTLTQRETGEKCYSTARNTKWKSIVEHYSERKLTVATDRLVALEGLRRVLCIDDSDLYLCGLWRNAMPDQLLWQVNGEVKQRSNPLQLPSWTWAAVPAGIKFLPSDGAKSLCETISCKDGQTLVVRAKMRRLAIVQSARREGQDAPSATTDAMDVDFTRSNVKSIRDIICYIYDEGGNEGWLCFDVERAELPSEQLFCVALMGSLGRRDEEKERVLNRVISKKLRQYWVLVLRRFGRPSDLYERVGVGKTYGREWWMDELVQDVSIK